MTQTKSSKAKVAVIGLGNIGKAVSTNLVKGNRSVIVADRKMEKATALAQKLGTLAKPMEIPDAIREADIIVLAIWFNAIKELLDEYAVEFKRKIIVDPSNPIAPDEQGGFKKIIGEGESAGEIIASLVPENAALVKMFGTLGVASLTAAAFQQPDPSVLFYATDAKSVKDDIEQLIHDSGFEPVGIGGMDQSIRIEVFGDLHEFGALGKTVTLQEAREKLAASVPASKDATLI